jgi:hypothetical protein
MAEEEEAEETGAGRECYNNMSSSQAKVGGGGGEREGMFKARCF